MLVPIFVFCLITRFIKKKESTFKYEWTISLLYSMVLVMLEYCKAFFNCVPIFVLMFFIVWAFFRILVFKFPTRYSYDFCLCLFVCVCVFFLPCISHRVYQCINIK